MKALNEESKGCEECRYNYGGKCSVYIYENGWNIRNEPKTMTCQKAVAFGKKNENGLFRVRNG